MGTYRQRASGLREPLSLLPIVLQHKSRVEPRMTRGLVPHVNLFASSGSVDYHRASVGLRSSIPVSGDNVTLRKSRQGFLSPT